MIVAIIMILTDWLMVGVTKMVYSCKVAYRQGMIFGVHVPEKAAELPEVKTMIEKYQSWMKTFYRWNYGQSLADTPEYVCVEDEEWLVREGLGERAGDKCRGYKDNRKNCQNGSFGDLACTAAGFALWAVVDSGSLACYDG